MLQIKEYAATNQSWPKLVERRCMVFILINYPDGEHWFVILFWKEGAEYLYTVFDSLTGSRTGHAEQFVKACVHLYTAMDISWRSRSGEKVSQPLEPRCWKLKQYDDQLEQPAGTNRCGYHCITRAFQVCTLHTLCMP